MRICIIAEGSYPHVLGGVSSWINLMINSLPEYEFIIYAIVSESSKRGKFNYKIPKNVIEIREVFLDEMRLVKGKSGAKFKISEEHTNAILKLMLGEEFKWEDVFEFFDKTKFKNISEFFMSKNFYSIAKEVYMQKYRFTPFTEFLWNIRSMYVILFYLLMEEVPEADLYHSVSTGYAGVLASFGKYKYGSKYILSEHGIYTREREEEIIKSTWIKSYHKNIWISFFRSLSNCSYKISDVVTSLFKTNKELQIQLGCPEEKIIITPNGVDVDMFKDIKEEENENEIIIGTIARVVPIKDLKTMILSFEAVKREIQNTKLYILGPTEEDPEYFEECKQLIKQLDIKDVIFTGTVKIVEYIGKIDILLLTSLSEGQPLGVMEGMAAKKPHVCTNVGHCDGLLNGDGDSFGSNGYIEAVMDYEGIAKSIIKLCKSKELRKEMGNSGYQRVKTFYTKKGVVDTYRNLYKVYGGSN